MKEINKPHENDVLCGRGGATNSHPGNLLFRGLVTQKKKLYLMCRFKNEKRRISQEIVDAIRKQNPSGRFLNRDDHTGRYYDIGDAKAHAKASQALREGAPKLRQEIMDVVMKKNKKTIGETSDQSDDFDDCDEDECHETGNTSSLQDFNEKEIKKTGNPVQIKKGSADDPNGSQMTGCSEWFQSNYCGYEWHRGNTNQQYLQHYPPQVVYEKSSHIPADYCQQQIPPNAEEGANWQYWQNNQYRPENAVLFSNVMPRNEFTANSPNPANHRQSETYYRHDRNPYETDNPSYDNQYAPENSANYHQNDNSRFVTSEKHAVTYAFQSLTTENNTNSASNERGLDEKSRYSFHNSMQIENRNSSENSSDGFRLKRDDSDEQVDGSQSNQYRSDACNITNVFNQCGMPFSAMFSDEKLDPELSSLHESIDQIQNNVQKSPVSSNKNNFRPLLPRKGSNISDRSVWSPMVPMLDGLKSLGSSSRSILFGSNRSIGSIDCAEMIVSPVASPIQFEKIIGSL